MQIVHESVYKHHSDLIELFEMWCLMEWGNIDAFNAIHEGRGLPEPLLAIENNELIAGLGFTWKQHPELEHTCVWISGLIVAPAFRRQGIASQLIKHAENLILPESHSEVFVNTDSIDLYKKQNWKLVNTHCDGAVLSKLF